MAHECIGHPALPCPESEVESEVWKNMLEAERQEAQSERLRTMCSTCGDPLRDGWPPGWCALCHQEQSVEIPYAP